MRFRFCPAAHAADLNTFDGGTRQCLNEVFAQRRRVGGESEVRPVDPSVFPSHPVQVAADHIYGKLGIRLIGVVDAQAASTDQPPRRQRHNSVCSGFPCLAYLVRVIHTQTPAHSTGPSLPLALHCRWPQAGMGSLPHGSRCGACVRGTVGQGLERARH